MTVAVIGATGFVGKAILHELLDRDHMVTGIARHPEKLGFRHPALSMKTGDVMDEHAVAALVKGQEAVISAYNPEWTDANIYNDYLHGAQAIQAGVKRSGVRRFIVSGGGGSLEIAPGQQLVDQPDLPAEFKDAASAVQDYLEILKKEQDLEWTFFSPAIYINIATSGKRRGKSILSVEDHAVAIVDELESPKYIRQRFTAAH